MGDKVGEEEEQAVPAAVPQSDGSEELSTGLKLVIGERVIEEIWALGEDFDAQKALLAKKLEETGDIEDAASTSFGNEVICDFHLYNMIHCKSICLSARKASVFHAIMHHVLDSMKRKSAGTTRPGESYTSVETFTEFQQLMLKHSVDRPPDQIEVFLGSEARLLTDYVSLTFFKHYLLYQYCLVFPREVETLRVEVGIEAPMPPPLLQTAKLLPEPKAKAKGKQLHTKDPAQKEADETQLPPDWEGVGDPAVEAMIDRKIAESERKLDGKLQDRETKFMNSLQNTKR